MDKHFTVKRFMKLIIFSLVIIVLSSCSHDEEYRHIEVFVTETSEQNVEGLFETTGYKKVNAITTIEEGKNHIKADIKSIEDFYDTEGNYIRTDIVHTQSYKSNISITDDGFHRTKVLQEPSTILIPDNEVEHFQLKNMSDDEMEKVKNHVISFMDMLN